MTPGVYDNGAFDPAIPGRRLVWNATTMAAFLQDPLTYYWRYVLGFHPRGTALELVYGEVYHAAMAEYWATIKAGGSADEATVAAMQTALEHKDRLEAIYARSPAQSRRGRSFKSLMRALAWYAIDGVHKRYEGLKVYSIEDQWYYQIDSAHRVTGTFDQRFITPGGLILPLERKTTNNTIGMVFWRRYNPSVQVWTYALAAERAEVEGPTFGGAILCEPCQTGETFARYAVRDFMISVETRAWWQENVKRLIVDADFMAAAGSWARNANPNAPFIPLTFRDIMTAPPRAWRGLLEAQCEQLGGHLLALENS